MIPTSFLDKLQLEAPSYEMPSWLKWAALGAAPVVTAYLLRSRGKKDNYETDFDSFLVAKVSVPTGIVPTKKGPESGPFEGFLKDSNEDHRDPAVFSTFLKSSCSRCKTILPDTAHSVKVVAAQHERSDPSMANILVLYGTEYGFSKEIAEKLANALKDTKLYW
jgi:sulfite reductase (NADPH) flavoprotein alpha-component